MVATLNRPCHICKSRRSDLHSIRFVSRQIIVLISCGVVSTAALGLHAGEQSDPFQTKPEAEQILPVSTKVLRYTQRMIGKYDTDKDGQLQQAEWELMQGEPTTIDTDLDGRITPVEFAQHVARYGRHKRILLITPESTDESPQVYEANTTEQDGDSLRRSKRYYVPSSRLPKGLSQEFFARDLDGDGQLTRSEFAPNSTSAELGRFKKLDANLDGVVTAREYAEGSQSTSTPTSPEASASP